jgi:phenylalanyl-tRNA synthetase beta chain
MVTSMAELDPRVQLEQVTIVYPEHQTVTPDLTPQIVPLRPEMVASTLGIKLSGEDVQRHLLQMGHGVRSPQAAATAEEGEQLLVEVPAYRNDIMHPIDLVEDVAIAYGYHNIVPTMIPTMTVGKELDVQRQMEVARRALTGLGYIETLTLTLSSEEADFDALRLPRPDNYVVIDNPISVEQTIIRTTILPGLLDTFAYNTHHELPQRIFEIGNITLLDSSAETGAREWPKVAAGIIGPRVDYSEIRSACQALLREFDLTLTVAPDDAPLFIPGRGAKVIAQRGDASVEIGRMGELHPEILERYKLIYPVAVFEVDLPHMCANAVLASAGK